MTKTTEKTVEKFLMSLVYDHIQNNDKEIPQIMGQTDGSEANIQSVVTMGKGSTGFRIHLTDGTKFSINVEKLL